VINLLPSLLLAFALGVAPAVSDTSSTAQEGTVEGLRQLQTAEIRAFLVGSTIERGDSLDPVPRVGSGEQFGPDGTYVRFDDRDQVDGTYRIANDEVCVRIPKREPFCRQVFLDTHGNPWMREPRSETENRFVRYSKSQH
jgi:hypothetical protein